MSLSTYYESVVITISHFCQNLFMVYPLINVVRILCFSHNVYHLYSQLMNINISSEYFGDPEFQRCSLEKNKDS